MATAALINGDITGALDETFTAGDLGDYAITEADDGGTEIVLGEHYSSTQKTSKRWLNCTNQIT